MKTPNLDSLAANGIRFTNARANGPQCSPSRSSLITGKYAVSLGTEIHREKRPVPDQFYFPKYLREAGYYTTNNAKQDYNNIKTPPDVWNESSNKASYQNRSDKNVPFFSVFNCNITHMTRVATITTSGRSPRTVNPASVKVPSYIPDLPDVRDDISWNMDAVKLMDNWVGKKLAELQASGEAENTIIFFYSDHGGTVPRGKAYLYESGTRVPMIAYFPKKWAHLAGYGLPAVSNRLISFVDLAPTIFALAAVNKPDFFIGKPFLGTSSNQATNLRKYHFSFRANQGPSFAPSRAITDGRYKLIWNFQSAYPNGTRQDYQWQMPAQLAWDKANIEKNQNQLQQKFWQPVEPLELYDLEKDSLETNNLANNKSFKQTLDHLKSLLHEEMITHKDLGFIPRSYRQELQKGSTLFDVVNKQNIAIERQILAAEVASYRDLKNLKILEKYLEDKDPVIQYWGASGICGLAKVGLIKSIPKSVENYFNASGGLDEAKCLLAEAMIYLKQDSKNCLNYLFSKLEANFDPAIMGLQNLNTLAKPLNDKLKIALQNKKARNKFYIRSILINTGALPFSALYDSADGKIGD
ncbi:MAG: sulfatase [Chryseobacterium sp.]|nr:MAG: sulfatase [Chryseobacterium sp.]